MNHETSKGCVLLLAMIGMCCSAVAEEQQITRLDTITSAIAPASNFTGRVRLETLWPANGDINASGALVTFEPGARSHWHIHPAGQRLLVTAGIGYTQEWGKPVQVIRPGDQVWCPPGVKHWHGAAPKVAMTHLAISGRRPDQNVTWMEEVTDEQYKAR